MKKCDLLLRGMVITMNPNRDVYTDGYLAIKDGLVVGAGTNDGCEFVGEEETRGEGYIAMPGLVNAQAHLVQSFVRDRRSVDGCSRAVKGAGIKCRMAR